MMKAATDQEVGAAAEKAGDKLVRLTPNSTPLAERRNLSYSHALRLRRGTLTVSVVEAPDCVHLSIESPGVRGNADERRLRRFLLRIVRAYEDDPRPVEMAGNLVDWTGRVEPCAGGWVGYAVVAEARQ